MGIFSGIEILFFVLGVLSTLLVLGLIQLNKKYQFNWYIWLLSATGAFLIVFTTAWSVSSILEGEVQVPADVFQSRFHRDGGVFMLGTADAREL